jgi:sigma-B regulation protein RsbU (phosphoserine phosphatase)
VAVKNLAVTPSETSNPTPGEAPLDKELDLLRTKVQNLSSLIEVSIIINSTLDLEKLVSLVMEKAQTVMNAEASSVMLINEEEGVLECQVALGEVGDKVRKIQLKMGEGIAGWVAEKGVPLNVPDVSRDPRFFSKSDESTGFKTRSILAVPLKVKEKIIGVAEVINRLDGKPFDDDDVDLFSTFCRQVAMAIDNARMHRHLIEKERLEQQLEAAKIIQQSFMPQSLPSGVHGTFDVAAQNLPATAVGGDFYDFFEFDEDSAALILGDVSGKGVPAALYMARLVSDLRFQAQMTREPAALLQIVNDQLVQRSRRGMFVTLVYGLLDVGRGRLTYSNAGHLPLLYVQPSQQQVTWLRGESGMPLGVLSPAEFSQQEIRMNPGDLVILVTDGVVEAKNSEGGQFGFERLEQVLREPLDGPSHAVEKIFEAVQAFAGDQQQHDDVTVLALRWNGSKAHKAARPGRP